MNKKKPLKLERAKKLAMQFKDMPYHELKVKIKETVPCGSTTAHKAIKWVEKEIAKPAEGEEPILKIEEEKPKEPLAPQLAELPEAIPSELRAVPTEKPLEEITEVPEVPEEKIMVVKDTLRSLHILFLSKKGLLGEKYGNNEEACIEVSDMAYRWMEKRAGAEVLERYDTAFLVMGYVGLIGNPAVQYVRDRQKAAKKKRKAEK